MLTSRMSFINANPLKLEFTAESMGVPPMYFFAYFNNKKYTNTVTSVTNMRQSGVSS